ncbi:MAG: FHA domain-containing protein [Agathobacter sp.]|nr:FHA domain-containing protein [Agathobacter sp.]
MKQRQILFERTLAGSYMKIEAGEVSKFDEQMLQRMKLPGLLPMEKCYVDGGIWYWYDISGKQSLDTFCRIKPLGESFLKQMLCSVCAQMEILEQHLIYSRCLRMDPELIYIVNSSREIVFTALPGADGELTHGFGELMEYLLTKIDHKDAKAVRLAYEIYEMTLQEGYRIHDIRNTIFAVSGSPDRDVCIKQEELPAEMLDCQMPDNPDIRENKSRQPKQKAAKENKTEKRPWVSEHAGKCKLIFEQMTRIWDEWKKKMKSDRDEEEDWRIVRPEDNIPEFLPEQQHESVHPTICLTDYREHPEGLLLYEGYERFENIRLEERSVQVGQSEESDIKIAKDTISRMHARIEYREEEYYLEDLNSTNGTFVNDEQLSYKQARQLKTNDIVRFADVKYRFV